MQKNFDIEFGVFKGLALLLICAKSFLPIFAKWSFS
jgi:hypothetical protein